MWFKKKVTPKYRIRFDGWLFVSGSEFLTPNPSKALEYTNTDLLIEHDNKFNHIGDCVIVKNFSGKTEFITLEEFINIY